MKACRERKKGAAESDDYRVEGDQPVMGDVRASGHEVRERVAASSHQRLAVAS